MKGKLMKTKSAQIRFVTYAFQNQPLSSATFDDLCVQWTRAATVHANGPPYSYQMSSRTALAKANY
jgi:hypothetical protein